MTSLHYSLQLQGVPLMPQIKLVSISTSASEVSFQSLFTLFLTSLSFFHTFYLSTWQTRIETKPDFPAAIIPYSVQNDSSLHYSLQLQGVQLLPPIKLVSISTSASEVSLVCWESFTSQRFMHQIPGYIWMDSIWRVLKCYSFDPPLMLNFCQVSNLFQMSREVESVVSNFSGQEREATLWLESLFSSC